MWLGAGADAFAELACAAMARRLSCSFRSDCMLRGGLSVAVLYWYGAALACCFESTGSIEGAGGALWWIGVDASLPVRLGDLAEATGLDAWSPRPGFSGGRLP